MKTEIHERRRIEIDPVYIRLVLKIANEQRAKRGQPELKLDFNDLAIIDAMRYWINFHLRNPGAFKGQSKVFPDADGRPFVWVAHKQVGAILPLLNLKPDTIQRRIQVLCDPDLGLFQRRIIAYTLPCYRLGLHGEGLDITGHVAGLDLYDVEMEGLTPGDLSDPPEKNPGVGSLKNLDFVEGLSIRPPGKLSDPPEKGPTNSMAVTGGSKEIDIELVIGKREIIFTPLPEPVT